MALSNLVVNQEKNMALVIYTLAFLAFLPISAFLLYTLYLAYVHWKYSHLPGPKRDCFYRGHVPHLRRERAKGRVVGQAFLDMHREFGPFFVVWLYHTVVLVVCDPELAKKCVVTLNLPKNPRVYSQLGFVFGERLLGKGVLNETDHQVWKKRRSILNPAFHRRYLINLMATFNDSCDVFLSKIGEFADGQTSVDMAEQFSRVTLDVIGKIAFDADLDAVEDASNPFPSANAKVLEGVQTQLRTPWWKFNIPQYPFQRTINQATRFLRKSGADFIRKRQEAIQRGEKTPPDILAHILSVAEHDSSLTMEDLVDEFVTFFIAGQETTSNQLSFTLYEMLKHPDVEERLQGEIKEVLQSSHYVEYQDFGKLQYLSQVLKESLRLHPPISGVSRVFNKDETLLGYHIPSGTSVSISVYVSHHLPAVWDRPEAFDPDRFAPSNSNKISNHIYWPFLFGPRSCIGQTFAQFEARVIMARLLQEFELKLLPGQEVLICEQRLTLRPKGGVLCTLKRRTQH